MKNFLNVENKIVVIRRILEVAQENHYKLVAEFEDDLFPVIANEYITDTALPKSADNIWDKEYRLKAFNIKQISDYFIANIFAYVSVLTLFEDEEKVLLIADNLHKHCFSCSDDFYNRFVKQIEEQPG